MRIGTKVVIKRLYKAKDWTPEYNGLKAKIINRRTEEEAEEACGVKERTYELRYEKNIGRIRYASNTGWFAEREFKRREK